MTTTHTRLTRAKTEWQRPQSYTHPRPNNVSQVRKSQHPKRQHPMAYRPPRAVTAPPSEKKSIAVCVLLAFLAVVFWVWYLKS
jgi:hypothetical protein